VSRTTARSGSPRLTSHPRRVSERPVNLVRRSSNKTKFGHFAFVGGVIGWRDSNPIPGSTRSDHERLMTKIGHQLVRLNRPSGALQAKDLTLSALARGWIASALAPRSSTPGAWVNSGLFGCLS
jgi:hypothetical protein